MKLRTLLLVAATVAAAMTLAPAPAFASTPLPAPTNLVAVHVSDTAADLWWNSSGLTAGDVVERQVNGVWRQYATGLYGALALTSLTPATTYTFRVYSIPVAGLGYTTSPRSAPVSFTTLAGPDTAPPTAPPAPIFSSVTTTGGNVYWAEATDNVQVTGYYLQQLVGGGWTTIRTVDAASRFQSVGGLNPSTAYSFAVLAFDAKGNTSPRSAAGIMTTLATTTTITCKIQLNVYGGPSFSATLTLLNSTSTAINGWTVGFSLAATATTGSVFSAVLTRTGSTGTLTPLVWDSVIQPGGQFAVGFSGSGAIPADFAANGTPCT